MEAAAEAEAGDVGDVVVAVASFKVSLTKVYFPTSARRHTS